MKFATILTSLLVLVLLHGNVVAADHSAELFLQLGHSRSVTVVAVSPDGQTLASGSGDNTIIYWDDKSREILTRTVLLPGNQ